MAVPARSSRSSRSLPGEAPEPEKGEHADQERGDCRDDDPWDVVRRFTLADLSGLGDGRPRASPGGQTDWDGCGLARGVAFPSGIEAIDVDRVRIGEVVAERPVLDRHAAVLAENRGLGIADARQREPPLHGRSG